ncbi:hypothetical protein [Natrialba asiatica]|uniref:Uncharacterized protein n=1 Tax=Natrialba asiatica (strain ATCC 700177 / DSM 12278 / JCM 9576 / FERM P-10747 / NBRC 102637 / 172P1) TaxID=29540 RepID=M0AUH4_NATA1|nr:hypothetical protein [Natrialba asiatica]ELZ02361.1 hypothetical protein C481_06811 [Natrialba asiatica DSM 12278]
MDDDMLSDQRELVDRIEAAGWDVTDLELSAYDSPWSDEDDPEATVTITARKPYDNETAETSGDTGEDGDDENPFRLK